MTVSAAYSTERPLPESPGTSGLTWPEIARRIEAARQHHDEMRMER